MLDLLGIDPGVIPPEFLATIDPQGPDSRGGEHCALQAEVGAQPISVHGAGAGGAEAVE